jgi:pimeloyl-ACP methyl ester carboxylesterase
MKNSIPSRFYLAPFLFVVVALGASCAPAPSEKPVETHPRTIVFVHGAWGGGWQYTKVQPLLEGAGHTVYRPTMTGLGERVHLAGPDVGLSTHVEDIVKVLEFEDLHEVVLVGHSYGGMVIAGVADRMPERIAKLVFFDAILPEDGESVANLLGDVIDQMATAGGGGAEALAARASMGGGGESATGGCATAVAHLYRADRTRQPAGSAAPGSISPDRRSRKRGRRS